jgi:RNA polymerase subunit RPABC4/transcription elongation factor Spt4
MDPTTVLALVAIGMSAAALGIVTTTARRHRKEAVKTQRDIIDAYTKSINIYQKTIGIREKTTEILEAILDRAKNKTDNDTYDASRMCISCGKSYPEDFKMCPHCFPTKEDEEDKKEKFPRPFFKTCAVCGYGFFTVKNTCPNCDKLKKEKEETKRQADNEPTWGDWRS